MPTPELCTDEEIASLVHAFYAKVRRDALLGPIFERHITDWDHHLGKLVDFWSSILRGTMRYSGTPMPRHIALPEIDAALFRRWLVLFHETTSAQPNRAMAERADAAARRIARSLWFGYQMSRAPDQVPLELDQD